MKTFLKKIALFIFIPIILCVITEAVLPFTFFTHRHWEALPFMSNIPKNTDFYPNMKSSMIAVGDLCHHTINAIPKKEIWITDKLGFRNDEFVDQPDILFIGDSFTGGTSLSQDQTIAYRVKSKFNNKLKVYSMAPSSFSTFDRYFKTGVLKKPKLIIYSRVERGVPEPIVPYDLQKVSVFRNMLTDLLEIGNLNMYIDKGIKHFSVQWAKARIHDSKGLGVVAKGNSNMFFINGTSQKYVKDDLYSTAESVISYKKYCDSLGINFLFIPMPNKETVYYELVPFEKQPDYLQQLDSLLQLADVKTINTLNVYNNYRKTNNKLLYHLDDSHWNPNATELISKEIINLISSNNNLIK